MVARDLRRQIQAGELAPNSQLPSEKELAPRYGVSRNTIRAALADLRRMGLVRTGRRKGSFVVDHTLDTWVVLPQGLSWRVRPPYPEEVEEHGLLDEGEPVVEFSYPDGRIEVSGTVRRSFECGCGAASGSPGRVCCAVM